MMRAAVYYAPAADDPLWRAGTAWLGRDPEARLDIVQPDIEGLAAATASPRRYGFHATLKPPMALAHGLDRLIDDVRALVHYMVPFEAPRFTVARLDGFLALVEATPSAPLRALADACVVGLDHHRVGESADLVAKRAVGLDAVGEVYLRRFGYPYVLERWRFHMTLSERLSMPHPIEAAALQYFGVACAMPRMIDSVAIYSESAQGATFELVTRIPLGAP
jgi:hypothetical protein